MNLSVKYPVAQTAVFFWIGFVGAISFMEAWLKFQAPGITIPLGLGIGQLVFSALNSMEWVFAIVILGNLLVTKEHIFNAKYIYFFLPLILLLLQSIWLLPVMDTRAELIISGADVPDSVLHYYYVGMEIVKLICLFIFGLRLYKKS